MKIGRNDPCPCGSGKKYKHCCLNRTPDMSLQTTVFFGKKYDEKFQRRIDYVTDNIEKIKKVFHLKNNSYKVIPYMVTNKLFYSRYKDIAFEIITYSELKDILSGI